MAWLGWIVKEKSKEHPRGYQVSGRFQTKSGADDMRALLEADARKNSKEATYFVTDLTTKDGG